MQQIRQSISSNIVRLKMKRNHISSLLAGVVILFLAAACGKEAANEVYLADDTVYFTPSQGSKTVTVFNAGDSGIEVTGVSDAWFGASAHRGEVVVTVDENLSSQGRNGTFSLVCGTRNFTVKVVQFGTSPDFSSLPDEISVECSASRVAVGYVVSATELELSSDADWLTVWMDEESIIFADVQTNELPKERIAHITVSDGDSEAVVTVVQDPAGLPEVSYTFQCLPDGLSYKLSIDVSYKNGAVDYRVLVLNPSGFGRTDEELYHRLVTGTIGDYVFSNDNETPDGKITFLGFDIDQQFQICIVAVSATGEFGTLDRQTHTIKDSVSGEGTDKYNFWLGDWKATGKDGSKSWELVFLKGVIDEVLFMQGWDNIYGNFKTPVYFDKATGNLTFKSAFISYATSGGRPCNVYFLPIYNMTAADDISFVTTTGDQIATARWSQSGDIVIEPSEVQASDGTIVPEALGYVSQFSTGYETVSQFAKIPLLPMKLERIKTVSGAASVSGDFSGLYQSIQSPDFATLSVL